MKPVSSDKLYDVLDRVSGNLARRERCLSVTFDRQTDLVPLDRILYVEAQRQFVAIHTKKQVYRRVGPAYHIYFFFSYHLIPK